MQEIFEMNKQAYQTPADRWGTPIKRDLSGVEILREIRGVRLFDQMPTRTRWVYSDIARCFPGIQVWAVGSRVRGDYVMERDGDFIREARRKAGMKDKVESDFDFLVSPDAVQVGDLPPNTERVKCLVPKNERIEIPVFYGMELG